MVKYNLKQVYWSTPKNTKLNFQNYGFVSLFVKISQDSLPSQDFNYWYKYTFQGISFSNYICRPIQLRYLLWLTLSAPGSSNSGCAWLQVGKFKTFHTKCWPNCNTKQWIVEGGTRYIIYISIKFHTQALMFTLCSCTLQLLVEQNQNYSQILVILHYEKCMMCLIVHGNTGQPNKKVHQNSCL